MVLSVNSSSKVFLGFTAVAALALSTVLFYRSRGNTSIQPTVTSLDKGRFAFLSNVPLIGYVYNHFNPIKTAKLLPIHIGFNNPIDSVEQLTRRLTTLKQQREATDTLVIYGNKLEITNDPGILVLNPKKVILVGVQIVMSFDNDSLGQLMVKSGWNTNEFDEVNIIEVDSVEEAVKADLAVNPTVYSVRT